MTTSSSVHFATWEAVGFAITLFSSIFDFVTASVGSAVGSASIGGSIVIFSSIVAFFTDLNNAITTDGSGSRIVGWHSNTSSRGGDWVSSVESLQVSVGCGGDDVGEGTALSSSQQSGLLNDEPSDILSARWSSFRSSVGESANGRRRNQKVQINVPAGKSLSAGVKGANW